MKDRLKMVYAYVCQVTETLVVRFKMAIVESRVWKWLTTLVPQAKPITVDGILLIEECQPRWRLLLKRARPWLILISLAKLIAIACVIWGCKAVVVSVLSTVAFIGLLIIFEYLLRIVVPLICGAAMVIGACLGIGWGFISSKLDAKRAIG